MKSLRETIPLKIALTILWVVVFTSIALGLQLVGVTDASIVLTLLMAVVLCSWAFGWAYSVLSSVLAILSHSYFFSLPIYSFEVYNPQLIIAFAFLIVVGLVVSTLSSRLRDQVSRLAVRESRLAALHRLGQSLANKTDRVEVLATAESLLSEILGGRIRIVTTTNVSATGTRAFVLAGSERPLGWVTFEGENGTDPFLPERKIWIETLLAPVALAVERVELSTEKEEHIRAREATETRNTILHGISHDLRTPLTVISATASAILEQTSARDPRKPDLESLMFESQALVRQVENILELTSLTSGSVTPRWEWVPVEDLVYGTLEAFATRHPEISPAVVIPDNLELCRVDEALVHRALGNFLENAFVHAPGPMELAVTEQSGELRFEVRDRGEGVPEADRLRIFGQFMRGSKTRGGAGQRGTGLGLSLVSAVAKLHGGNAGVESRPGGGAVFWLTVDHRQAPPALWGGNS